MSFQVNDGLTESNVESRQIAVTPVVSGPVLAGIEPKPLAYTQGDPATAVAPALLPGDFQSASLAGATVWISGNYHSGEDLLAFNNTATINGSWNAATGTLSLSGVDTLADYQAALRSVTYVDSSLNPSSVTRTVSFQVDDRSVPSNIATQQVVFTPLAVWKGNPLGDLRTATNWVADLEPNPAIDDLVLGGATTLLLSTISRPTAILIA